MLEQRLACLGAGDATLCPEEFGGLSDRLKRVPVVRVVEGDDRLVNPGRGQGPQMLRSL